MISPENPEHNPRLEESVLQTCDAIGSFIEYWGFKKILGRVWALLALHREPLTQTAIADKLGVSRSLVSGAIAELLERGLVSQTDEHRNAPYVAELDIWPTVAHVLRTREWMLLEHARNALEVTLEEIEIANEPNSVYDANRIHLLLRMTEASQTLVRMIIALRVPSRLDVGEWIAKASSLVRALRNR